MFDLVTHLAAHHIVLTPQMESQFEVFHRELVKWNETMNLTGITEKSAVYEKHFYDSLSLAFALPFTNQTLCDVGAGAGFPSIPLAIAFPEAQVTVIDSLAKRMKFVEAMRQLLPLPNLSLQVTRAETFTSGREQFDIVTARAVASLPILLELLAPLAKVNGYVVAYKGDHGDEEFIASKHAMKELGLVLHKRYETVLPFEQSTRILFIFKKISPTSMKYPRPFAKIQASPL